MTEREINRLERMAAQLEKKEARLQEIYGNRIAGTTRSADMRDAKALRDAVAILRGTMRPRRPRDAAAPMVPTERHTFRFRY